MVPQVRDRKLAYEAIVEVIKGQLLDRSLKPGDQLPTITDLAIRYEVGQGAVREAYRILESRGLLEVVQGKGTFVAANLGSGRDVLDRLSMTGYPRRADLLEARVFLEPQAARLAAIRANGAEREAILAAAGDESHKNVSVEEWVELNLRFHTLITLAAHNPVVSHMLAAIYELFKASEPHPAELPIVREKGTYYHKLIALAISDGDADVAETMMRHHIQSVERILESEDLAD